MPRRRQHTSTSPAEPSPVLDVHTIQPTSVYTTESFRRTFGLRATSLRREVREGRLKVYKRCGKYYLLGEDILAWIRGGAVRRQRGQDGE